MKTRLITLTVLTTVMVGFPAVDRAASLRAREAGVSAALPVDATADLQTKGRFKKEGDNCVWNAEDSGPNQCAPVTRGRFKKGGDDSCTWVANDNGPDQCTPPAGRWKRGDNRCYWDPKDSGPNQCNPRQARK
jgi:hypothetical protein